MLSPTQHVGNLSLLKFLSLSLLYISLFWSFRLICYLLEIICYIDITVYGLLKTSVSISKQHWAFIHSFLALIQVAKCFKWAKRGRKNIHLDGIPVFGMIDLGPGMILWNFQRQLRSQIAMDDFVPMGHLQRLQFDYNDYRRYASRLTNQSYRSLRQTTETIAHWGSKTISIVHCGKRNKTIVH